MLGTRRNRDIKCFECWEGGGIAVSSVLSAGKAEEIAVSSVLSAGNAEE